MKPEDKDPSVDAFLNNISGKNRVDVITENKCAMCGDPDLNFREEVDRAEYAISGMCQRCQDKVFGLDDEDDDD